MKNITFHIPYDECIDEKATLQLMKKHLKFLSSYSYLLEQKSQDDKGIVEDEVELMDYVTYTKSVISPNKNRSMLAHSTKMLNAIEQYDRQKHQKEEIRKERRLRCIWLMLGIEELEGQERTYLIYKYIHNLNNEQLSAKLNHVSISTLNRIHNRACISLAYVLELEVLKDM